MTPEVEAAIQDIRDAFAGHRIDVDAEEQGGAYVVVNDVQIGPAFRPASTWVGFLITFQYPRADVYPHFIDPAVQRADGQPLGAGMSGPTTWHGRSALQVSRKSPRWNSVTDTATVKLQKVIAWLQSR